MTDPHPNLTGVSRYMTLIYLVGAARKDANPEQLDQLKAAVQLLREPAGPGTGAGDVAQRVVDIMGPDWMPGDEWIAAIEAITGKKFR